MVGNIGQIADLMSPLREAGIFLSLFIDPYPEQIEAAKKLNSDFVELNTAAYSEANSDASRQKELSTLRDAFLLSHNLGLGVHAGHGLTYLNVEAVASLPHLQELNIGHSIVSHSVFVGFERAVREMTNIIDRVGAA